jgi:hypothetical protein
VDMLEIKNRSLGTREDHAVQALRGVVEPRELARLGAVEVRVSTRWPSVSMELAQRLIRSVNEFNVETRRLEAQAERQFAEAQAATAQLELAQAEDRLKTFLQRNRSITGSPDLTFENDRLQRDVMLRQQMYTSLLQNQEEARLRAVRDLPVITVLEHPRLPLHAEARHTIARIVGGAFASALLVVLFGLIWEAVGGARLGGNPDASAFFEQLRDSLPGIVRRRISKAPVAAMEKR